MSYVNDYQIKVKRWCVSLVARMSSILLTPLCCVWRNLVIMTLEMDDVNLKLACKSTEIGMKIAWKRTLRQSNFKSFPGETPGPHLWEGVPPLILSPLSRLTSLDSCLRHSVPHERDFKMAASLLIKKKMALQVTRVPRHCRCQILFPGKYKKNITYLWVTALTYHVDVDVLN